MGGDFFDILPVEICEIIFSYLRVRDLLSCALVSKDWLNFVGSIDNRILLKIDGSIELDDLFCSKRTFRRFKISKIADDKIVKILKFYSNDIRQLEIEDSHASEVDDPVIFPNMRELTVTNCNSNLIKIFLSSHAKLKILNLFEIYGNCENLIEFLKLNGNITEINFYLNEACNIFDIDLSTLPNLRLSSVFISYKSSHEMAQCTLENIEKFLCAQGDHLEVISLINSASLTLLYKIWNSLKVVKRFYFFSSDPFFDYPSNLTKLTAIESLIELELHSLGPLQLTLSDVSPFLEATRNLKSFGIWQLRKNIIEFIATNLQKVKHIGCAVMETDCQTFYDQLRSKNGINDKLHIHQYL
jgi:F-box-like